MLVYRLLTDLAAPGLALYLWARRAQGKEDPVRFHERFGQPSLPRPKGRLVWCHAASVGEAMSVLSLLNAIRQRFPSWRILLTTGTVTSASLLVQRLPAGVLHQYVPVDRWHYVSRFLDHWRPDVALFVESEMWPNMLTALKKRNVPTALLNGRMSVRSFRRWSFFKTSVRKLLETFAFTLVQTDAEVGRFLVLGAKNVACIGNLKYAAEPLPCDDHELDRLRVQAGNRPVWLIASTHPGEDEIALDVHAQIKDRWPGLLTLIVPRHPARGEDILKLTQKFGLRGARRAVSKMIVPSTEVYIADTLGELGLFYRLAPIACLGGSFVWGGHNPIEPAQLGSAIIFGPNMTNFAEIADELLLNGAAIQVHSPSELALRIEQLMSMPREAFALANTARAFVEDRRGVLDGVMQLLGTWLDRK